MSVLFALYITCCLVVCFVLALPNLNHIIKYKFQKNTKDAEYYKKKGQAAKYVANNKQVLYDGYVPVDEVADMHRELEEAVQSSLLRLRIREVGLATMGDIPLKATLEGVAKPRRRNPIVSAPANRDPSAFDYNIEDLSD